MDKKNHEISKFLSYILRHEPQSIGLQLNNEGWANIELLISKANKHGQELNFTLIKDIVKSSDKKRFSISSNGLFIRALQGHSTSSVKLQHEEKKPPNILYHGTATRFLDSIRKQGLIAGSRHHVHMSQDLLTAANVGQRYGKLVIIEIEALKMHKQGFKFFQAQNSVWLTDHVPNNFISEHHRTNCSSDMHTDSDNT